MKRVVYFIAVVLLVVVTASCEKGINLVNPEYRKNVVSGGGEFEIQVMSSDWAITGVKDLTTGEQVLDKENNPMTLKGNGEIVAGNGWLMLVRESASSFVVRLKENFNDSPRNIEIYITDKDNEGKVTFVQSRGKGYKLAKAEFELIAGTQGVYTSDEGCHPLILTNETSKEVWKSTEDVFKDVVYSSKFESDEYGAFEWADENLFVSMPELIIDNSIWWAKSCLYKQGEMTVPFNSGDMLLVEPYATISLKGEVTYCTRAFNYVFTIENESTGAQFKVRGVWTQIVPLTPKLIIESQTKP